MCLERGNADIIFFYFYNIEMKLLSTISVKINFRFELILTFDLSIIDNLDLISHINIKIYRHNLGNCNENKQLEF